MLSHSDNVLSLFPCHHNHLEIACSSNNLFKAALLNITNTVQLNLKEGVIFSQKVEKYPLEQKVI